MNDSIDGSLRDFHAIIRPIGSAQFVAGSPGVWSGAAGKPIDVWSVAPDSPSLETQSFKLTYEAFAETLSQVPRLFLEPDGSFVWVSNEDPSHRISGQITDDGSRVLYLELRGRCCWEELAVVVKILGWPEVRLAFQLLPEAMLVKEIQFRALVCGED